MLTFRTGSAMGSRRGNLFSSLPTNVTSDILSQLQGQDLCNTASTCRGFRRQMSTVEILKVPVALGEIQAKSLLAFLVNHQPNGLQVCHFLVRVLSAQEIWYYPTTCSLHTSPRSLIR